jgi:hypothetical protein
MKQERKGMTEISKKGRRNERLMRKSQRERNTKKRVRKYEREREEEIRRKCVSVRLSYSGNT